MEQAKALISAQGWTPQIKIRREARKEYLYAAKRFGRKMVWRYIGLVAQLETMTEEAIIEKISKQ